MQHGEFPN